jgi:hypothetical protein
MHTYIYIFISELEDNEDGEEGEKEYLNNLNKCIRNNFKRKTDDLIR